VATPLEALLTAEVLEETIRESGMKLKEVVLDHLDEIYERFVMNVGRPIL
jgi:hypothetical protein